MESRRSLMVLATIAVVFLLHWGQPFFVPLLIAILLSYALAPAVSALTTVVRNRVLAAAIVVLSLIGAAGTAMWAWSDDVETLWQKLPVVVKTISKSVQDMAKRPGSPVREVQKAAAEVEAMARTQAPAAAAPAPQSTALSMWDVIWRGGKGLVSAATQAMVVLFLLFFMLASGDLFKRKLVAIAGERLSQQKDALRTLDEINRQIRNYLGILLISNVLVGLGVWASFAWLGVEYAGLWGLAAGIVHTAPYFGPALIAGLSLVAAFVQFHSWSTALIVAGSSLLVTTLVGMVFATWLASRAARMNATASFVGLLFFGWIWDLWGVLLAIPILAIIKAICDRKEEWKTVAELLGE